LPGILIPFPYATDDHQTRNAEIYARVQAAILLKESEISGELLARKIRELIQDPPLLEQMAANCSRLAPKDAAGRVATTMEKYTTHEPRF
jgi:UDP-N-acetylglucosamine--N-acetylmuramyl-(pentapeptide) pyrophosphoryl-undecaprenol N-acetylglucosamine transferase